MFIMKSDLINAVGEHKRILYDKTVGRYASESKTKIHITYLKTGSCVQRETELDGAIQICKNLNGTYHDKYFDAWVVKTEDGTLIEE